MSIMSTVKTAVSNLLGGGVVPKVKIESFKQMNFTESLGKITLPLVTNEGIKQKYSINWGPEATTAAGESAKITLFNRYENDALEIETIVDATGVYRVKPEEGDALGKINYDTPNIEEYISEMRRLLYGFDAGIHQPPYITLTWGKIFAASGSAADGAIAGVFKGVLSSMEITYELFSSEGKPIRARVSLKFLPFTDPKAKPPGNSPDLTHIIEVKPGDNLAKLCNKVYESPDYYHQVAQINGLASVYAIRPGMKLMFPPLDKNTR